MGIRVERELAFAREASLGEQTMDTVRQRIYPAVVTVLLLVIAAVGYGFTVAGSAETTEDGLVARSIAAGLQLVSERTLQGGWPNEHSIEKK
jgi:hypothetical protein